MPTYFFLCSQDPNLNNPSGGLDTSITPKSICGGSAKLRFNKLLSLKLKNNKARAHNRSHEYSKLAEIFFFLLATPMAPQFWKVTSTKIST